MDGFMFLNWIEKLYRLIVFSGNHLQSLFLFLLRLAWGSQFLITGMGKLMNLDQVSFFFVSLQIPFPYFSAVIVGIFEAIGGLFLVVGLSSRLICIPLAVILFTAYATAHVEVFYDFSLTTFSQVAKEAPFPFLFTVLIVFIFGPGKVSIDAWIKKRFESANRI